MFPSSVPFSSLPPHPDIGVDFPPVFFGLLYTCVRTVSRLGTLHHQCAGSRHRCPILLVRKLGLREMKWLGPRIRGWKRAGPASLTRIHQYGVGGRWFLLSGVTVVCMCVPTLVPWGFGNGGHRNERL